MEDHWQHNQPNTEEWQTVMTKIMIIKLTLHQPMRDLEETKEPKQGNGSQHSRSNPCPHALCGPSQVQ